MDRPEPTEEQIAACVGEARQLVSAVFRDDDGGVGAISRALAQRDATLASVRAELGEVRANAAGLSDIDPSDCQCCSEAPDPCRQHADDPRYWRARAMDAEQQAVEWAERTRSAREAAAISTVEAERATLRSDLARCEGEVVELRARVRDLESERDNPETRDFLAGVAREAAHQRARWGAEHDAGKEDSDWLWLIGYLAGKALHKPEKRLHHLITTAAALLNWHRHDLGKTNMRPGIDGESALTALPTTNPPGASDAS